MNTAAALPPAPAAPAAQAKYQVRFDWGLAGAARIAAGADVVVWVDVLGPEWRELNGIPDEAGIRPADAAHATLPATLHATLPATLLATLPPQAAVLTAGFTTATATARWITALQHRLGRRAMIAIVAAGEPERAPEPVSGAAAGVRFAVEDQLAAGAVIDALATLGTDYCSPEAAASCAAFTGLRGAVAHLLTASASAQQLVATGVAPAVIRAAGAIDSVEHAVVLRA